MDGTPANAHSFYSHSGRAPIVGLALGLAAGLGSGTVLAIVYSYVLAYIPFVGYVTFVLSLGFGALVGLAVGYALRAGRVRNVPLAIVLALGSVVVAQYVAWLVWVHATLGRADLDVSMIDLLLDPAGFADLVGRINETGTFSIKGTTVKGTFLWVCWVIEALMITGAALLAAFSPISHPFCERCQRWCVDLTGFLRTGTADREEIRTRVERRALAEFVQLGAASVDGASYLRFDVHSCEGCREMHTLDAISVVRTVEKGEVKESEDPIVSSLLVTSGDLATLREVGVRIGSPSAF